MFKTHVGPVEEDASVAYLRPETAQGIFMNFANVATAMRRKLPFGIAQIGKSFRNEITPGNFIFRLREFEQMEMEFFVPPADEDRGSPLRSTNASGGGPMRSGSTPGGSGCGRTTPTSCPLQPPTTDIEYDFPMGWSELEASPIGRTST